MSDPLDVAADIDRSLRATSRAIETAVKEALADAAVVAKRELGDQARIVPGGDRKFSRWYPGRGTLGVRTRQRRGVLTVAPRGPWKVAEEGARPHGGHPGTRGKQGRKSWTKGEQATYQKLDRVIPKEILDRGEGAFKRG